MTVFYRRRNKRLAVAGLPSFSCFKPKLHVTWSVDTRAILVPPRVFYLSATVYLRSTYRILRKLLLAAIYRSVLLQQQWCMLCTSGFVDNVTFPHNCQAKATPVCRAYRLKVTNHAWRSTGWGRHQQAVYGASRRQMEQVELGLYVAACSASATYVRTALSAATTSGRTDGRTDHAANDVRRCVCNHLQNTTMMTTHTHTPFVAPSQDLPRMAPAGLSAMTHTAI